MYENKTRMITNKLINTIGYKVYRSHKLSAIIRDKVSAQIQNNRVHGHRMRQNNQVYQLNSE